MTNDFTLQILFRDKFDAIGFATAPWAIAYVHQTIALSHNSG
ncbi:MULTISPECIES: hypothetical protein [unclassified Nostoc]|nr:MULTISPECIES: hypothetical protein [unclassified Nostoc]